VNRLGGRLEGAVALIPDTRSILSCAVERLLKESACEVVSTPDRRRVDILIVPITERRRPAETATGVFSLVHMIRNCRNATGVLPRRVVALISAAGDDRLALSLTRSVVIYLTAHTAYEDVRINVVHAGGLDDQTIASSADVALALASGWLDGMRGQVLEVPSLAQRSARETDRARH